MKSLIKSAVRRLVGSEWGWRMLDRTVLPFARYAEWMRAQMTGSANEESRPPEIPRPVFGGDTVQHGPFKGMLYRNDQFCCSAIAPKLLGSYEREIHPWIEQLLAQKWDGAVDVGCAEGYYAVGFAWKIPNLRVYAYDINETARAQCRALAEANGVADRVEIRSFCDAGELGRLVNGRRFLVIADCEGYEKELFTPANRAALARADVLVEVHDFMDLTITPHLRGLFAETHEMLEAESIDDLRKLDRYAYPELDGLDLHTRYRQIAEWRQRIMLWMWMRSKSAERV